MCDEHLKWTPQNIGRIKSAQWPRLPFVTCSAQQKILIKMCSQYSKKKKHPFGFCGLLCLHMTIIRLHIREQLWALTCSSVDSNVWGFSAQENIFNIALLLLLLLYSLLTSPNNPTDLTAFQSKVSKCLVKKPLKSLSSFKVKPMWEKWAAFLAGQLNKYNDVTSQEEDRQKKF